jgi:predicted DCC family thiol-disulfide oxidoreductase YuxK
MKGKAVSASSVPSITWPLTVYFDGSCRLCRSEIDNIAARDTRDLLRLVDCSAADFDDRALPYKREAMMQAIHARDAEGVWLAGVDVFVALYQAAHMNFVARLLNHRVIKPRMAQCYPWIARHRRILSAVGVHHLMNFFAARARKRRLQLTNAAALASARSATCASDACEAEHSKSANT